MGGVIPILLGLWSALAISFRLAKIMSFGVATGKATWSGKKATVSQIRSRLVSLIQQV